MSHIPPPRPPRLERGITISSPQLGPVDAVKSTTPSKIVSILPSCDALSNSRKRRPFFVRLDETRRGGKAPLYNPEGLWDDLK